MNTKPTVHYTGSFRIHYLTDYKCYVATVYGVLDHPILGRERSIHTSQVLSVDFETGIIETRNTLFCPNDPVSTSILVD